jgi:folylpolyglutamate synthase/dihydropteroate synthase
MRTILLAATALAALTGCQSAAEKQRLKAESGDLANCARIRVVSSGCGGNSGFTKVYVDNMHKDHAVRATVRKHSQEDDDETEYAIAESGQLFVGCGGGGTSFAVVGCEVLKGEAEKR